jgi:hypothetical protein
MINKFEKQDRIANELLLKKGIVKVFKVARSGATTSLIKRSIETKKKIVIIVPTKRILNQLKVSIPRLTDAKPKIVVILPNEELCLKLDPSLKLKFQFKENCSNCEYQGDLTCPFQRLLLVDYDVYGLTYDKLNALFLSRSNEAKTLLAKLWACDVFIFDEITTAIIKSIVTLKLVEVDEDGNISKLSTRIERLEKKALALKTKPSESVAKGQVWSKVKEFIHQFETAIENGACINRSIEELSFYELGGFFRDGWDYIQELTKRGLDTSILQDVFLVALRSKTVNVNCQDGEVSVTPRLDDALDYLSEFKKGIAGDKPVFRVDSYQPPLDFESVFGCTVTPKLWGRGGDPLGTTHLQLIVSDTAHWSTTDFYRDKNKQLYVKFFITDLLNRYSPENIIVVTTNKRMAKIISHLGLPKEILITWHRSDLMRGVTVEDRRIMVCVSGPYLPKKAYVDSASSFDFKDFVEKLDQLSLEDQNKNIAKILRATDTRSEFVNAVARVKDPRSEERSIVFTLGMKLCDVKALLHQHGVQGITSLLSQPELLRPYRYGGLSRDGLWIIKLWFDYIPVKVDDIPLIARIIRIVEEKQEVPVSVIVPNQKQLVLDMILKYDKVLAKYNIHFLRKRGGVSLQFNESNVGGDEE